MIDRIGIAAPLRNRDFRLLWGGTAVSLVGDGIFMVALAWQVYELTGNPAALGLVGVAWTVPQVALALPAGVGADRIDRRVPMLAGDVLRGVAVAAIAALSLTGHASVGALAGLAIAFRVGDAIALPAFTAIVPSLVSEDELLQANALAEFVMPITRTLLGPFVGGLMVAAWSAGWAFAADAVTFAASIAAIVLMRKRAVAPVAERSAVHDLREGLRYVATTRWFLLTSIGAGVVMLTTLGAWEVLIPFLVKNDLHDSAAALGFVYAAAGVGGLASASLLGQRSGLPPRPITAYYAALAVSALGMIGFGMTDHLWEAIVAAVVVQAFSTAQSVLWYPLVYRLVPDDLLGRVSSVDMMVVLVGLPLSYALVGPIANLIGTRPTFIVTGAAAAAAVLLVMLVPGALTPERDGSLADRPAPIVEGPGPD